MLAYADNFLGLFYPKQSKKELERMGFANIDFLNLREANNYNFDRVDLVYVCGGNTFAILHKLREKGFDQQIIAAVNRGALYVGVSAGTIIAGPSIEVADWGSEGDSNDVGLQNLTGFGFINIAIFPHYHDELSSEVEEFKNKVNYPIQTLTDSQLLYIENNEIELVER